MPENALQNQTNRRIGTGNIRGCGSILLLILVSVWVIGLSGADLFIRWTIEQAMYQSEVGIRNARWVVHLVYVIGMAIPLITFYFLVHSQRLKLVLGLWLIGLSFSALTVPAKALYLTSQNQTILLNMAAMLLMIACIRILKRSEPLKVNSPPGSGLLGSSALIIAALAVPWVMWGSLGSILDTLLALLQGFLFALFINQTVFPLYLKKIQDEVEDIHPGMILLDGFIISVFLLITVTGISHNGSQLLLALTIPLTGWILTAFSAAGRDGRGHGRGAAALIASSALALPVLFFDMDELSLMIASSPGEVINWSTKAGWVSFFLILTVDLVVIIGNRFFARMVMRRKISIALVGISLATIGIIYGVFGQPGFFGDRIFVIFSREADTNLVSPSQPLEGRKQEIYELLTRTAVESQASVRKKLDTWGIDYTPYYLLNAMEVRGGLLLRLLLERQPGVDRVLDSPRLRPLPQKASTNPGEVSSPPAGTRWNLEMINVPQVHTELGVTGKGILIGQTDSGVDGMHPELSESYRGFDSGDSYNWFDPWNGTTSPVDAGGHGTMTLGIEVGKTIGIAPDAQWIGCVNLARNLGNPAVYLDCMQFMFAPFPQGGDPFTDGEPDKGAMIINNSWGCPRVEGCDTLVFKAAMEVLKNAGIFMSAAAGNTGDYGCSTVSDPPAIYDDVFTTGSVDKVGQISSFSSLGPVSVDGSNRLKPDLLAPGEQILLAAAGGGYSFASGTSFAAPHVSGVVALMWSANPELIGDIDTTTRILLESAQEFNGVEPECGGLNYGSGAGILDAYAAVQAALGLK